MIAASRSKDHPLALPEGSEKWTLLSHRARRTNRPKGLLLWLSFVTRGVMGNGSVRHRSRSREGFAGGTEEIEEV